MIKRAVNYFKFGLRDQTFIIYENKEQVDSFKIKTANIIKELPEKAKELNIEQIDLIGPPVYLKGLIKRLKINSDESITYNII